MRRRKFIRIVSYFSALCAVLALSGYISQKAKADYEETLERVRLTGLASLCEYYRELSGGLRLMGVSTADTVQDSSAYVCSRALGAVAASACFDGEKAKNIIGFGEKVYDFAENFSGSENERSEALKLSDYAMEVYYHLSGVSSAVLSGEYSLSEHGEVFNKNDTPYFEDYIDYSNGSEEELFSLTASAYPGRKKSAFLADSESVTEEKAREKAGQALGIEPVLLRGGELKDENGTEVYSFFHDDAAAEISRKGGMLISLVNPMPCSKSAYSAAQAQKIASEFLNKHGYYDMQFFEEKQEEMTCVFIFAPRVNGIILLTSCVELSVCLASGKVTYFNAFDYIRNYRADIVNYSGNADIRPILPDELVLKSSELCLAEIGGRERLCRLAVCLLGEDEVLVFVDAVSNKILKMTLFALSAEN